MSHSLPGRSEEDFSIAEIEMKYWKKMMIDNVGRNEQSSDKNSLDHSGIYRSGGWNSGNYTSHPSNGAFLYGNRVLLCKEL